MNDILVTNIQRFSLHDGPGVRTTVFLKGCSLRCPWCSNPENLVPHPQEYNKDGKKGSYGYYISPDELVVECLKDKPFYEGNLNSSDLWSIKKASEIDLLPGGVTFSGGEALLQAEALFPVFEKLHKYGVHISLETCLFVSGHSLEIALSNIDFFYVDVKILNAERCMKILNGDLTVYLSNFHRLMNWTDSRGNHKPVVIRVPVIGKQTDYDNNRHDIEKMIRRYKENILKIELIKEHNLGESKYRSLGMQPVYFGVDDRMMEQYKSELDEIVVPIEICRI